MLNIVSKRAPQAGPRTAAAIAAGLIVVICSALALAPQIDLALARLFYDGHRFVGDTDVGRMMRDLGRVLPIVILAALALAWVGGRLGLLSRFAPRGRSLAWCALAFALGPGLAVDGVKDISHRPRPVHVAEFGGAQAFRPFWRFDGACARNCSFPSGEAAAAFWTLLPASLAPPPLRLVAVGAAAVFALVTGGLRMAFGGHFLSDVFFGAILTFAIGLGLRKLFWPRSTKTP